MMYKLAFVSIATIHCNMIIKCSDTLASSINTLTLTNYANVEWLTPHAVSASLRALYVNAVNSGRMNGQ